MLFAEGRAVLNKLPQTIRLVYNYRAPHNSGVILKCGRLLSTSSAEFPLDLTGDACPQGIQGDDCITYKLWEDNCKRYGFANCNEQLQGIQSGRKTLAEVFAEQEKLIEEVTREYRAVVRQSGVEGVQSDFTAFPPVDSTCPQGVQGDDCIRYRMWLENCHRFGIQDCMEHYASFKSGRMTLAQIFAEQDKIIRGVVNTVKQHRRNYSTSAAGREDPNKVYFFPVTIPKPNNTAATENPETSAETSATAEVAQLSQRQKLQRAVKEYGSTVVVFHVTISLASLGFFYLLVSSGLDVAGFLLKLNIGGEILKSKLAAGTGTFVIAYAVHKVFAPVRIATTLTATPFIVRYLRRIGFLKVPKTAQSPKTDIKDSSKPL